MPAATSTSPSRSITPPWSRGCGERRLVLRPRRRLEQKRDLGRAQHERQLTYLAHDRERGARSGGSSVNLKRKRRAETALLMLGAPTPVSVWCSWKRRTSSAVAVSGERPMKAANVLTCRT